MTSNFGVTGFRVDLGLKDDEHKTKCEKISKAIESILKQYDYAIDKEINHDLMKYDENSVNFNSIKSKTMKKYCVTENNLVISFANLMFGTQSNLTYTKNGIEGNNFYELLNGNNLKKSDFPEYTYSSINDMFKNAIIIEDSSGFIRANIKQCALLAQLFASGAIPFYHQHNEVIGVISDWVDKKWFSESNKLFTPDEADMFDFS